jgi:hypothetical protein
VTINADALDWYIRESVFNHLVPEQVADLLRVDEPCDNKLKQLLDQRAAQQFRLDGLVDDYASGLLDRVELVRAKSKAIAELSRINGQVALLEERKRRTEVLTVGESVRQAWEANENVEWRSALIGRSIERIEVFPGISKPLKYFRKAAASSSTVWGNFRFGLKQRAFTFNSTHGIIV